MANNFIWGWLLLPVTQLGELVKRDVATDASSLRQKVQSYAVLTAGICWFKLPIPLLEALHVRHPWICRYGPVGPAGTALAGLYVVYAFQNIIHAVFFGLGKTNYILVQSVVTNAVYYGGAFLLYRAGHLGSDA